MPTLHAFIYTHTSSQINLIQINFTSGFGSSLVIIPTQPWQIEGGEVFGWIEFERTIYYNITPCNINLRPKISWLNYHFKTIYRRHPPRASSFFSFNFWKKLVLLGLALLRSQNAQAVKSINKIMTSTYICTIWSIAARGRKLSKFLLTQKINNEINWWPMVISLNI